MKNLKKTLLISLTAVISLAALIVAQTYMIFVATSTIKNSDSGEKLPGSVGLRRYFDSGSGTSDDPYIITRPIHFYNLSRLQDLGAFPNGKYFQVGKTNGGTTRYVYGTDAGTTLDQTVLDMTDYSNLVSIGSTATPFFGQFDGGYNGTTASIVIANLKINSQPEDIGVFGYIASGAIVKNMVLADLTVTDDGYYNRLSGLYVPTTAYDNVAGIVTMTDPTTSSTTSITDTATTGSDYAALSSCNLSFGLNSASLATSIDSGTLDVEYGFRGTNKTLFALSEDGLTLSLDTTNLSDENNDFQTTLNVKAKSKIYVTGTVTIDNIKYAKIVASYTVTLIHQADGKYGYEVYRDTSATYTHATNIGFIAGHSDGSITDCYVSNGTFSLNNSSDSKTKMASETDLGLLGEAGVNIDNLYSPTDNYEDSGDTGIINFTSVLNNVITPGTTAFTSKSTTTGGVTTNFYTFKDSQVTSSLYYDYLRKMETTVNGEVTLLPLTNAQNSIDFKGRQIIKENADKTMGLGIFQLNTADYDNSNPATNYAAGLGSFKVTYDSANLFSNIYYTTAEFDNNYWGSTNYDVTNWKVNTSSPYYRINQGTSIPTVSFSSGIDGLLNNRNLAGKAFEKNFNYNIKLNLDSTLSTYYMNNTNCGFLADYFNYKLHDKLGNNLAKTSSRFGLMVVEKNGDSYVNTSSFSSYLGMDKYSSVGTVSVDDTVYPSKTIQFNIDNSKGANITLIARSNQSNPSHIGIYKKDSADSWKTADVKKPLYAMYVPGTTNNDANEAKMNYYFSYDNSTKNLLTNQDGTYANPILDTLGTANNKLYAHTFYIAEAGDYFIESPDSTPEIYYMAVQGQKDNADIGGQDQVYSNTDIIDNMDFLLYDPKTYAVSAERRAYVSFTSNFNLNTGTFAVTQNNDGTLYFTYATSNTVTDKYMIYNPNKKTININGTASSDTYIMYNWS